MTSNRAARERVAMRCAAVREKEWPGHTAVLWRKRCKRNAMPESIFCWQHGTRIHELSSCPQSGARGRGKRNG